MVEQKLLADRSQAGNKSCFRNEKYNGVRFTYSTEWILPQQGEFEFDFVFLMKKPTDES